MLYICLIIVFGLVVLSVDGIGCLVSIHFTMRYARRAPASIFFYAVMRFAGCLFGGWKLAVASGVYVGLFDALSVGPYLGFWDRGRSPNGKLSVKPWLATAILNIALGCAVFSIGAVSATYYRFHLNPARQTPVRLSFS